MVPNSHPARRLIIKQVLYHPLTWVALGLHALLLVAPYHSGPPPLQEEDNPEANVTEAPIDVLSLSEIASSTPPPQALPQTQSSQPASPADLAVPAPAAPIPPVPPPALPPQQAALPDSPPVASPAPVASAAPAAPVSPVAPAAAPASNPPAPQPPAYDPSADQGVFIGGLGNLGIRDNTAAVGLPNANSLRRPENFANFINGSEPVAGALSAKWLDEERNDLVEKIGSSYTQAGLALSQLDNFGGEALYALNNAEGKTALYVSIVELKGSSLVVMWQNNPLGSE